MWKREREKTKRSQVETKTIENRKILKTNRQMKNK